MDITPADSWVQRSVICFGADPNEWSDAMASIRSLCLCRPPCLEPLQLLRSTGTSAAMMCEIPDRSLASERRLGYLSTDVLAAKSAVVEA
jgi:hypothetical protein